MRSSILRSRETGPGIATRGAGFTLIELLVVIGIIAILVSMAVVVGTKVVEGGKTRATQNVIRALDETLNSWMLNADEPLPSELTIENPTGPDYLYPLIDAKLVRAAGPTGYTQSPWPTAELYSALVMQDASIKPAFEAIDSAFVGPGSGPPADATSGDIARWAIPGLKLKDAWGQPLRLVHPKYHGGYGDYWDAQNERLVTDRPLLEGVRYSGDKGTINPQGGEFRRSYRPFRDDENRQPTDVGDADEGMCIAGVPYFYSPGQDGDPGTREDNVYSTVPRFPAETRRFE